MQPSIVCTCGKHLQRKHPPVWQPRATYAKIVLWCSIFITDKATSMTIWENHHKNSSMMRLLWWTGFCHKFVIKLKLWRIWLFQWWKLIVIEVDIPSSVRTARGHELLRGARLRQRKGVMEDLGLSVWPSPLSLARPWSFWLIQAGVLRAAWAAN